MIKHFLLTKEIIIKLSTRNAILLRVRNDDFALL